MEYDKTVKQLVDRYYAGETTLDEEKMLKTFFRSENVPAELQYAKYMFDYFDCAASGECESDVVLHDTRSVKLRRLRMRRILYAACSVAAAAVIVAGVFFSISGSRDKNVYCYLNGHPVEDIELAKEQSQLMLTFLNDAFDTSSNVLLGVDSPFMFDDDEN